MSVALPAAVTAVRAWTRFYTWGLPPELRESRREEIDSDLWESVHEHGDGSGRLALHIIARLIIGIPDDLGWRTEQVGLAAAGRWRVALTALAVLMLGIWLVGRTATTTRLPDLPESVRFPTDPRLIDAPPPPPPPPPPCPPDGFPQPPGSCIR